MAGPFALQGGAWGVPGTPVGVPRGTSARKKGPQCLSEGNNPTFFAATPSTTSCSKALCREVGTPVVVFAGLSGGAGHQAPEQAPEQSPEQSPERSPELPGKHVESTIPYL